MVNHTVGLHKESFNGASLHGKGALFYLQPFQPKACLPRGGGVKKNTLPVKQQVGFEPGAFWSAVKCLNHLATVSLCR